jgi:hypothetical protein
MNVIVPAIVAGIMVLWLAATVLSQFGTKSRWIRSCFLGWCLPEWRLFAPIPGDHDYHIVYRTRSATGERGEFMLAEVYSYGRWRALWNPAGRRQKMTRDVIRALVNAAHQQRRPDQAQSPPPPNPPNPTTLIPYRLLLGVVMRQCEKDQFADVQFAILRETPRKSLDLVFLSSWHARVTEKTEKAEKLPGDLGYAAWPGKHRESQ